MHQLYVLNTNKKLVTITFAVPYWKALFKPWAPDLISFGNIIHNKMHCPAGATGTEGSWKMMQDSGSLVTRREYEMQKLPIPESCCNFHFVFSISPSFISYIYLIKALFTFLWCLVSYVGVDLNDQMFFDWLFPSILSCHMSFIIVLIASSIVRAAEFEVRVWFICYHRCIWVDCEVILTYVKLLLLQV